MIPKMYRSMAALALGLTITTAGVTYAVSVAPLTAEQEKLATQEIKKQLPAGSKFESIKFGFGKTPPNYIGSGFQQATVTLTMTFTVGPNPNGGANVSLNK